VADGHRLALTSRELGLLDALSSRPDRVVSRQELSAVAWERPLRPDDRSVDVYVSRVRAKLEVAAPGWRFIHTHFGFGYRFAPERVRSGPGVRPDRLHPFHKPATRR
jgi:DNA-binding response OmpR family regulator